MLKKLALALLGLLALYLLLLWSDWLPRTTPEQAAALELLHKPAQRAVGQRDAFPLLWSLYHAVPATERASLLAADQQAYAALEAAGKPADFRSVAEDKYPKAEPDRGKLCPRSQEADCLAFVRAQPDVVRAEVARHAALLARAAELRAADHARYGFRPSLYSRLPQMSVGPLQRSAVALQFIDGQVDPALDNACRDLAAWRRLRSHTDMLVLDMVGVAFASDAASLLATMLAELPADHVLPSGCAQALAAPDESEFDQCDVWRGEFASIANTLVDLPRTGMGALEGRDPGLLDSFAPMLVNERATIAGFAPHFARLCTEDAAQAPGPPGWQARVFNPIGSQYFEIALADYGSYRQRALDFAAILQGLRSVAWLRGQADAAAAFASRPEDLKNMAGEIRFDAAGQRLLVPLRKPRDGSPAEWPLPLAASRAVSADPATGAEAMSGKTPAPSAAAR